MVGAPSGERHGQFPVVPSFALYGEPWFRAANRDLLRRRVFPHDIKGQGIYCYVTLKVGVPATEVLRQELVQQVRKEIGPFASPDVIQWAPGLPKTRSGQDHAAHTAQDRREPARQSRRHDDAGGSLRGGRSGQEPRREIETDKRHGVARVREYSGQILFFTVA
jgi:hypothetical protein